MNTKTKEELYDTIIANRKKSISKYHLTDKGKEARKKASIKYYENNKADILLRKRQKYLENKSIVEIALNNIPKE